MTSFTVTYASAKCKSPFACVLAAGLLKKPAGVTLECAGDAASALDADVYELSGAATAKGSDVDVAEALCAKAGHACNPDWLAFARTVVPGADNAALLEKVASSLSKEKPFLTGEGKTCGVDDAIVGGRFHVCSVFDIKKDGKKFPLISRWFQQLKHNADLKALFTKYDSEVLAGSAAANSETETSAAGAMGKFELAGAVDGCVVTRFPPEPSGYLHIGHIKAALLNEFFAHGKYHGKLHLRFDDTNPAKEKDEFYESILSDLELVGVKADFPITYSSDYFDVLIGYAEQLIREGKAYVDFSTSEEISEGRAKGIDSKCRNQTVEENFALWEEMKKGSEKGRQCILRGKTDMKLKNRVMRDPSLYRVVADIPHRRTGFKYKVYPLYDFSIPIIDSIEGVTHALRSSEFHDHNELYYWVPKVLGIRSPHIDDFSRLNFAYVLLGKRKLQWFVDNGIVKSWEDPRFPTVRGLLRRGLTIETMREFVRSQGSSKNLNLMSMDKLWAMNRRIIDPIIPRFTGMEDATKVLVTLTGKDAPEKPYTRDDVLRYKKDPKLGTKTVTYSNRIYIEGEDAAEIADGEEITLMDWGNCVIDKVVRDASGKITGCEGHLHLEGQAKDTKKKLTWLSADAALIPIDIVEYDHLITADKIAKDDDFKKYVRPVSKVITRGIADPTVGTLKVGDKLQLERRGYFIVDALAGAPSDASSPDAVTTLIMIPNGTSKRMLGQKIVMQWGSDEEEPSAAAGAKDKKEKKEKKAAPAKQ